jgi:enoyl-CoA hydratase/carnithine racemase
MSVTLSVENHVATVTLNRPQAMNAVDLATEAELQKHLDADRERPRGARGGAHRRRRTRLLRRRRPEEPVGHRPRILGRIRVGGFGGIALRETLNVPVIARVNGFALGGGLEMVLGCDIVVACEEASFGLPEALVGRMPLDGGMVLLQRQVPFRKAMAMMLTGKRVQRAQALDMGLVNEVVPRAELDAAVQRWVDDMLACAPLSLKAIKQVVRLTGR